MALVPDSSEGAAGSLSPPPVAGPTGSPEDRSRGLLAALHPCVSLSFPSSREGAVGETLRAGGLTMVQAEPSVRLYAQPLHANKGRGVSP